MVHFWHPQINEIFTEFTFIFTILVLLQTTYLLHPCSWFEKKKGNSFILLLEFFSPKQENIMKFSKTKLFLNTLSLYLHRKNFTYGIDRSDHCGCCSLYMASIWGGPTLGSVRQVPIKPIWSWDSIHARSYRENPWLLTQLLNS